MFTRIVKMKFKEDKVESFISHFNSIKEKVRNQEGCYSVILFQDEQDQSTFFTQSVWDKESDLDRYRNSEFFKGVWVETKKLFNGKPEAWSVNELAKL